VGEGVFVSDKKLEVSEVVSALMAKAKLGQILDRIQRKEAKNYDSDSRPTYWRQGAVTA
jgi:hypothetical protein